MKKFTQLFLFCLILTLGILFDLAPIQVSNGIDKIYHFLGFALISGFAISTFVSFFGKKHLEFFLVFLLAFGGVFAGLSEFLQKFMALRTCDINDWLINLGGITIVVVVTFLLNASGNKKRKLRD